MVYGRAIDGATARGACGDAIATDGVGGWLEHQAVAPAKAVWVGCDGQKILLRARGARFSAVVAPRARALGFARAVKAARVRSGARALDKLRVAEEQRHGRGDETAGRVLGRKKEKEEKKRARMEAEAEAEAD